MNLNDAKILICDDSILARKQLKNAICEDGQPTILEARDGQEAVDIYKKENPNLVLIDLVMPNKDGNTAICEIMEYDPSATIVVVSSVGTQSSLKRAIESGARDFIQKPLVEHQVSNILRNYFGEK